MNARPLLVLAAIAAATSPDMGRSALDRFKGGVREGVAKDPMGSALAAVLGGAWLFYRAERGHNPKLQTYYDALVYVSTSLSGGYCDIIAKTSRGKAIGSALMTYGPAMASKIFDAPSSAPGATTGSNGASGATRAPSTENAPAAMNATRATVATSAASATDAAGTASAEGNTLAGSKDVLERLDRILALLEANRGASSTKEAVRDLQRDA